MMTLSNTQQRLLWWSIGLSAIGSRRSELLLRLVPDHQLLKKGHQLLTL